MKEFRVVLIALPAIVALPVIVWHFHFVVRKVSLLLYCFFKLKNGKQRKKDPEQSRNNHKMPNLIGGQPK
jgi:hypothetical protein